MTRITGVKGALQHLRNLHFIAERQGAEPRSHRGGNDSRTAL